MPTHQELHAYIDGSCTTNEQVSAIGVVIINPKAQGRGRKRVIGKRLPIYLPPSAAEVQAALIAMRYSNCRTLKIYSDSRYLVECAIGKAVPKHHLELWYALREAVQEFDTVTFEWIERNSHRLHLEAHQLARIARHGGDVDRYIGGNDA